MWLFLQGADCMFFYRRCYKIIVTLRPSFHPTQPVEGTHQPGLALDTGHRGRGFCGGHERDGHETENTT